MIMGMITCWFKFESSVFMCVCRWSLWYFKKDSAKAWKDNLKLVTSFDTVRCGHCVWGGGVKGHRIIIIILLFFLVSARGAPESVLMMPIW